MGGTEAAGLAVKVTADVTQLQQGLTAASKQVEQFSKQAGGIGDSLKQGMAIGAGFSAVTAGLQLLGKGFQAVQGTVIGFNSQLQNAHAAFTGLLGGAQQATAYLGDLAKFAATTPFEFPDVLKGAQRFLGMGMAAEKVIPLMRSVGTVVSAFGGTSETINRVTVALSQMGARGRVAAGDMNQLTEAGIPAWKMLADTLDLPIAKVRELSEQGVISSELMIKAIEDAANSPAMLAVAENMSVSWSAGLSNMTDGVRMFIATGTKPLFDEATKVVVAIGNWLTKSEDAKTAQAALTVTVRALMATLGPLVTGIGQTAMALGQLIAMIPGVQALGAAFADLGGGGAAQPAEEIAAGLDTAAASAEQMRLRSAEILDEMKMIPKAVAEIGTQLAANESSLKANAQAIKENAGELRGVQAEAEAIKESYGAQEAALQKQLGAVKQQQAALKQQIDAVKESYEAQIEPLERQADLITQQRDAIKGQAADIKAAYEDMARPIAEALRETEMLLENNKREADEVKASYAAQIEPLENALDVMKQQIDVQRDQQDLVNKIKSSELQRAKLAAMGDPVERARLAAQIETLDAREDELQLEKRAADIRKKLKDDKDVSPQEREILNLDLQRLGLKKQMSGLTNKQVLAELKVQDAALDAAKSQQDIQRAQEDLLVSQHQQTIADLKAEEKLRLDGLGRQRTALERQAGDQKIMLEGLKLSLEAALLPLEQQAAALDKQHQTITARIKELEIAEKAALAPLEARGKELERQAALVAGQIEAVKAAEAAALEPVLARQRVIELGRDALQAQRDVLSGIKADLDEQQAALEKRLGQLSAETAQMNETAKAAQSVGDSTKGIGAAAEQIDKVEQATTALSLSLQGVGTHLTPVLLGIATFKTIGLLTPIILGVAGALQVGLIPALARLGVMLGPAGWIALGVIALAEIWSQNWGDIQGKTAVAVDWMNTTGLPRIDEFFKGVEALLTGDLEKWGIYWAKVQADNDAADVKRTEAWNAWKADMATNMDAWHVERTAAWNKWWEQLKTDNDAANTKLGAQITAWWADTGTRWDAWHVERTAAWNDFWTGLKTGAETGWNSLVAWATGAFAGLGKMWTDFLAGLPKFSLPFAGGGAQNASLGGGSAALAAAGGNGEGAIAAAARKNGIDPATLIAFARHETGNFMSDLYTEARNIFSIKGEGPAGSTTMRAWEVSNGQNIMSNETFRKYNSDAESINDFLDLISTSPRYAGAWENRGDPEAFMRGLQSGGYATDPSWATNVLKGRSSVEVPVDVSGGGFSPVNAAALSQIGQFSLKTLTSDQAAAFCGPAAAMWFANLTGRNPTQQEALALAQQSGWTTGGMGGAANFVTLAGKMGANAIADYTPTPAEAAALGQSGRPFAIATTGHYFQAQGMNAEGKYNVGASGTALKGGSAFMSLDEMTALQGPMTAIITLQGQMGDGWQQVGAGAADFAGATGSALDSVATSIAATASAAGVGVSEINNFWTLMSQDIDAGATTAAEAMARMAGAILPVENAAANGRLSMDQLQQTLVEMAGRAGLAEAPLANLNHALQAGVPAAEATDTALLALIDNLGQANPAFAALGEGVRAGTVSMDQATLDTLNLLKAMQQTGGAVDVLGTSVAGLPAQVTAPITTATETMNTALAGTGAVAVSTQDQINTVFQTLLTQISATLTGMAAQMQTNWAAMLQGSQTAWQNMVLAIQTATALTISTIAIMVQTVMGLTDEQTQAVVGKSLEMSAGVLAQIRAMAGGSVTATQTMATAETAAATAAASAVVGQATTMQTGAVGQAQTMAGGVGKSFADMQAGAVASMEELSAAILGELAKLESTAAEAAQQVGAGVSEGVASGIRSELSSVTDAASAIVDEVDRALKASAEIRSPSHRFAWHGQMMARGVEAGFEDEMGGFVPSLPSPRLGSGGGYGDADRSGGGQLSIDYDRMAEAMDRRGGGRGESVTVNGAGTEEVVAYLQRRDRRNQLLRPRRTGL